LDPARKITQARVAMQLYHPFFGYLAISLIPKEKPEMVPPTMATDGTYLYYHPDFVKDTPLKHLMGIIAHEVGHIILQHLARRQTRERWRWNFAADYAVNYIVLKEFELPQGALSDPDYDNKSAEWIYNQIPVERKEVGVATLDSHEEWDGWGDSEGQGDGKGNGQGDGKADQAIGGDKADDMSQRWRELVAQATTQARMRGKMPGHLEEIVGEILQPKLDWKSVLTDMITSCAKSDFTLFPPNKKHIWRGFYLPGVTGTEIRIAVAIDSSGSISNTEIQEFLSEVHAICELYEDYTIWLFVCDTVIHQRFELHPGDPLPKTVQGRGGTDFREPFKEAENLPITSLVYMTDMYGTFPEKEPFFPVIWMATTDADAPWGFTIRYPSKDERG
jgi:predicted metal-dependent peptidase